VLLHTSEILELGKILELLRLRMRRTMKRPPKTTMSFHPSRRKTMTTMIATLMMNRQRKQREKMLKMAKKVRL
jgi:hypothetical protein